MKGDAVIFDGRRIETRDDVLRFIDEICRDEGDGTHDFDVDTLHCRRCGMSAEMMDDCYYEAA